MTAKNLGTGGSSLDARFGDGATSSTFPIHLEHVETDYLYLPGNSRNFATLAPSPSLEIVGDIDVSVRVALDNWTAADQTLIGRGYGNGYWFYTTATNIHFSVVLSGGVIYPGVAWSSRPANGSSIWLRATRVASTGVVTFYSGVDGPNEPSWTLIGTITSTSGNMGYPGSHPVGIGAAAQAGGSFAHATGKFYRVIIRNGINGTKVADVDFTTGLESGGQYSIINTSSDKRGIYASTVENLGTGGAQLDAISGSAVDTTTNDPLWLGIEESKFVRTPGVAGNYVAVPHSSSLNILGTEGTPFLSLPGPGFLTQHTETPDQPALDITGDIDVRVDLAADDWSEDSALLSKFGSAGNHSWTFRKVSTGALRFGWSTDGTSFLNATSTSLVPFADGQRGSVRATLDVDNAGQYQVSFFTSTDFVNWTPLGSVVNGTTGPTSIFNGDRPVRVGADISTFNTGGKFYRAQIRNGINGTTVYDADFTQQALGSRGFIESTGKLVSLVGNAAQIVDGTAYGFMPGVNGAYWSAPDSAALSITGDIDIRARISLNDWTPSAEQVLVGKWLATGNQRSYSLRLTTGGTFYVTTSNDGTAVVTTTANAANALTNGQTYWIRATLDVDDGAGNRVANFYFAPDSETEPTVWTSIGTTVTVAGTTSIFDGTAALEIGSFNGGSSPAAGRLYRVIIRPNLTSGTKVLDADFTRQLQFASTFTEGSANLATVTTQGAARIERERNLEMVIRVSMDDWNPDGGGSTQTFIGKHTDGTNWSWFWRRRTDNLLAVWVAPTGTNTGSFQIISSAAPSVVDGQIIWLKVEIDTISGNQYTARFYQAPDSISEPTTWTQIGNTITGTTGPTSFGPSTAPIVIGGLNSTDNLAGTIHQTIVRNGIGGQTVLNLDLSDSIAIKNQKYIPGDSFSTIPEAEQFLPNLGTGGSALNARYGASIAAEPATSDPLLLKHTGTNYLYNAGGSAVIGANCVTLPDSVPLRITGDLDIAFRMSADSWTPSNAACFGGKDETTVGRGYALVLNSTGTLAFWWSPLGTDASALFALSTVAVPFSAGATRWVRATIDVDNGAGGRTITFYVANDSPTEPTSWSQLGAPVVQAGTTSIFATTQPVSFGFCRSGSLNWSGAMHRMIVKNGIGGTTVLDVNTAALTSGGATTFTATTGQTATIVRATSGRKSVAVVQDVLLFGADDYLEVPSNSLLNFNSTDDFTVLAVARQWNTPSFEAIISKKNGGGNTLGWYIIGDSALSGRNYIEFGNGSTSSAVQIFPKTFGNLDRIVARREKTSTTVLLNNVSGSATNVSLDTTNTDPLRIGANSFVGPGNYAAMEFRAAAIWRRALNPTELALIDSHYSGTTSKESFDLLREAVFWVDSSIRNIAQINQTNILNPAQAKIDGAYVYTPGITGNYVSVPHSPSLNILGTEGTKFLSLPGVAGQYATTPDTAALDITGDIDIRVLVLPDNLAAVSNGDLFAKWSVAASVSWGLVRLTAGTLRLYWSANGTTALSADSTAAYTFSGSPTWVRVTLDVDNGAAGRDIKFYTSPDGTTWTQLGATVTQAGTTSIFSGTSVIHIGSDGVVAPIAAKFYRAQVLNGINGTVVFDADFTQQALGSRGFIESTGKLVSLVGNASQIVDGTTFGTVPSGSTVAGWTIQDDNQLDVSDFNAVIRVSLNDWTLASNQALISKYDNTGNQWSYILMIGTNGRPLINYAIGGVLQSGIDWGAGGPALVDGQTYWFRFSRNSTTGAWRIDYAADSETEPTSWTNVGGDRAGTAGALSNSTASTTIGAFNNAASGYVSVGKFYRAIIRNANTGGSKVLDVDFTRQLQFASTFTEGSSNLFTVTTRGTARIERIRNIELVARVSMDSWTPSINTIIIGKDDGTNRSWFVIVNTSGYLQAGIYPLGTSTGAVFPAVPSPVPVSNGQTAWIKFTINFSTGYTVVQGFWAPDQATEPALWSSLGTNTIAYNSFGPSSSLVSIGAIGTGTSSLLAGKVYRSIVRNGIGGPEIIDIDFSDSINTGGESYIRDTQLEAIPEAEQFLPNLGWGGTALNARYGASVAAEPTTSDPLLLTHTGENYLYLPGGAVNNLATIPDSPALDVVGDVDFRFDVALDTYRPPVVRDLFLRSGSDPNRYVYSEITEAGLLRFYWYPLGTNASIKFAISTAPVPYLGGERTWIRIVLDVDNGAGGHDVIFYISQDGINWSQLGNVVTGAGTTNLPSVTAEMRVWSNTSSGKIYRCQMLNGINGPLVYDVNFTTGITSGAQTTFTESSTNAATVTINRSTSGRKSVAVVQDVLLFGTDDYLEVPDNDLLDFGATDSFTVMAAVRAWNAQAIARPITTKSNQTGVGAAWYLGYQDTQLNARSSIGDGTNNAAINGALTTAGQAVTTATVVDRSAQTLVNYMNGTFSATQPTTAVGSLASSGVVRVGTYSDGAFFLDMEFRGSAVWRRALTTAELALVNTHYTSGPTTASLALMQEAVWWIDAGIRSVAQINRSLSGRKTTAVSTDVMLFGTNNYLEVPDNDLLDFGANDSFTVMTAVRDWTTSVTMGPYLAKRPIPYTPATDVGWFIGRNTTNLSGTFSDGSNLVNPTLSALKVGNFTVGTLVRSVSADTAQLFTAGNGGPTALDTTIGTLANANAMRVGRFSGASSDYADMEFRGSAIWRRALTSQEIALISNHYTTGPTTASNALLQEAVWWIDAKQSRSGAGISRSTSGLKSVTVTRPTWLVGNGRYFEVSDNNLLDANATQSFSIFAVVRQWPTPTNYGMYVNKVDSSIGDKGYLLGGHETNNALYAAIDDQPTQATRFDQATKSGKLQMVCMVVDRSVQTLRTYVDGVAGTVANIVSVGSLETGVPLRIGRTASGGTALHADVEIVSVGLFRRALTDKEVIDISAYYGTSNPINEATVLTGEDGNYLLLENGEPIIIE